MPGVTRGLLLRAGASTLCVALLALLGGSVISAKPTRSWQLTRPSTPARLAKLDGRLRAVVQAQAANGAAAAHAAAAGARVTATSQGMVVVVEPATRVSAAEDAVRGAGGTVGVHADGLIEARVPADRLGALAESPSVARVRAPALHMADAITGEGVEVSNAPAWQAAGFSGGGVKVGVIDLGFAGYAARLGSELPASVTTKDLCGGQLATPPPLGEVHGTAVAEVVHEVAPGAQLYLICIDSEVGLAAAVDYAKAEHITIVNHSVSWFGTSRGDGTGGPGTPDAIVADARQSGILWVNSAGNQARTHWSGGWSDPDGDGAMAPTGAFSVGAGAGACVMLRWDAWPATTQDYDLYFVRGGAVVSASVVSQADQPSEPFEAACWLNSSSVTAFVTPVVVDYSAPYFAGRLDYFVLGGNLPGGVPSGSLTEPASSPSAVAVGATCWSQLTPTSYSSRGPTVDGRTKPELLAPDSVSSSTYGPFSACETSGFAGTSAAAPHVAGAAALLKQRAPSASPGQLLSLLQANTVRTAGAGDPGALWLRRPVTGTALVYSQDGQIMVANADASSAHRLLSRVETSAAPAFKPDGTKVAYATSLAGTWQLAVADADGANEQILAASSESGPAWRPDGEKILFTASRGGTPGLFTIDADGTGETRLTSTLAADPDYAPGGSIAFIGATNDVYTANGDGSGVTNLTNGVPSSVNESPAFSPDGSKIAFAATGPVGGEIYVMKADGSEKTRLTNTAAFETDPVWSPDGKITFARRDAGGTDFDLFTMNADGTGQARLLRSPFTADQAPDWAATPPAAPVARKDPAISGEPRAGRWLTATSGSWHARVPFTTSFSWLRCDATGGACTAIPGATDSNHWIGASDVGSTIRVRVTADDGTATGSADSDATPVIAAQAPQNLSLPRISGQATVGSTLTALPGTWSGAPSAFLYQWLRCDVSNGCASIPGATGGAYVPTAGDAGLWLRVAVRAVHTDGLSAGFTVATSLAVTVQAGSPASSPPPPPPPPAPPAAATDAALQVTANAQSIARGDTVTFKLTVVNQHATGVASSVRVSYAIPIGAQLLAWPIQCVGGATFSCELGPLAPQQSTSVELKVRLNELGSTANVFTVTTTESDADPADNQVTVTIVVATKPAARQPRGVRKTGTARRDVLVGTRFDDVLRGLGGNDVLRGLAGNDLLYGGAGSDTVEGGAGNDLLVGGPGRDTIRCGSGKDRVTADRRDRVAKDCERVRR